MATRRTTKMNASKLLPLISCNLFYFGIILVHIMVIFFCTFTLFGHKSFALENVFFLCLLEVNASGETRTEDKNKCLTILYEVADYLSISMSKIISVLYD